MLESMTETVTLHRRTVTGTNVHGDDEGSTGDTDIESVLVAPNRGPGTEENVGQATAINMMTLYMPPGSPLPTERDEMTVRGQRWSVNGRPGVWPDGIEVFLRRGA